MNTRTRYAIILATVLAMVLAYLGGTFVSAQAPPAGFEAAISLLLDDDGNTEMNLPLILKR